MVRNQKIGNISKPVTASRIDAITLGFATATAMWTIGYLLHLPGVILPPVFMFLLIALCYMAGGFFGYTSTGKGISGGILSGFVASILNLLVLGSVIGGGQTAGSNPSGAIWIPGSIIAGLLLAAIGAMAAKLSFPLRTTDSPLEDNSISVFALVLSVATLILITVGGVVTSAGAGLAVVDWPNTSGYNMFLYPLSKMTGGIYYEHAHRLIGTLVGLITIALTIRIQTSDKPKSLKLMGWIALLAVVVQGIMGGLRVTGRFTTSANPIDVAPSIALAVVHGIFGQLFLAFVAVIAVLASVWYASTSWKEDFSKCARGIVTTRDLTFTALILVVIQLVIGAIQRHIAHGLYLHITVAVIVGTVVVIAGLRAYSLHGCVTPAKKIGLSLAVLIGVQILLGIGAFIAAGGATGTVVTTPGYQGQTLEAWRILVPTLHQATGAVILALSAALATYIDRIAKSVEK